MAPPALVMGPPAPVMAPPAPVMARPETPNVVGTSDMAESTEFAETVDSDLGNIGDDKVEWRILMMMSRRKLKKRLKEMHRKTTEISSEK